MCGVLSFISQFSLLDALMGNYRRAESAKLTAHWSDDVVQMILVLVFFIMVSKVPNGGVLSYVTQFLLLPCTVRGLGWHGGWEGVGRGLGGVGRGWERLGGIGKAWEGLGGGREGGMNRK
jgi:hypothetical protein